MSSSISSSDSRRYLAFLAVFSFPLLAALFLNFLFLRNVGELSSVPEIVDLQEDEEKFCIYGNALRSVTVPYKMEAYERRKPRVVLLGSSRVLNFRDRFFAKPFYNFGSTMTSVNEGLDMANAILQSPTKPDTVIIGMDFWWFNESFMAPVAYQPKPRTMTQFEGYFLFKPFQWLKEGKITFGDYAGSILSPHESDVCNIGIMAVKRRSGFGPDGSHYNTDTVTSLVGSADRVNFGEVPDVHGGRGRFAYAMQAHPLHLQNFLRLVDLLQAEGIDVAVFFPPFAPPIHDALQEHASRYAIFEHLREQLKKANVFFLDATDPASIGSSDCEFLDSVHAGDVAAARLLLRLDEERRRTGLLPIGNTNLLQQVIQEYPENVMVYDPRITKTPEVDFLRIGCKK
jgi:hypothetical protein